MVTRAGIEQPAPASAGEIPTATKPLPPAHSQGCCTFPQMRVQYGIYISGKGAGAWLHSRCSSARRAASPTR